MKLKQHQFSTQTQTSELKKPNPPTKDAIRKAKFKDKTFDWNQILDLETNGLLKNTTEIHCIAVHYVDEGYVSLATMTQD